MAATLVADVLFLDHACFEVIFLGRCILLNMLIRDYGSLFVIFFRMSDVNGCSIDYY